MTPKRTEFNGMRHLKVYYHFLLLKILFFKTDEKSTICFLILSFFFNIGWINSTDFLKINAALKKKKKKKKTQKKKKKKKKIHWPHPDWKNPYHCQFFNWRKWEFRGNKVTIYSKHHHLKYNSEFLIHQLVRVRLVPGESTWNTLINK